MVTCGARECACIAGIPEIREAFAEYCEYIEMASTQAMQTHPQLQDTIKRRRRVLAKPLLNVAGKGD